MEAGERYFHQSLGHTCTVLAVIGRSADRPGIVHYSPESGRNGFLGGDEFLRRYERLPEEPHPDDIAVDRFAAAMKAKLAAKRAEGRGGWDDRIACANDTLTVLLRNHVEKGDPVDVGNFAMMIHQRGETIGASRAPGRAANGSSHPLGSRHVILHDGFVGAVIGHYVRRDGTRGVVLQQDGTQVVHVYGEKWLRAPASEGEQ